MMSFVMTIGVSLTVLMAAIWIVEELRGGD